MNLSSDDFELFGLDRRFRVDTEAVDARWRALQGQVHPDKFASEGAAAQRVAMQWAVRVNEAHRRLKDPLRRAAYLCEIAGVPIGAETNTAMPADFLVQQMTWREALDDAADAAQVESLSDRVLEHRRLALERLASTIDEAHDLEAAAAEVRTLMFVDSLLREIDKRLEAQEG